MPESAITTSSNQATKHGEEFFSPILLIAPSISTQQELVLEHLQVQNERAHQQKDQFESEYIEINTNRSVIGIEAVRELTEQLSFGVSPAVRRFVILYFAEEMTLPAQNAVLKLLEEPPAYTQLVLVTNDAGTVLETIQSRCRIEYTSKHTAIDQNEYKIAVEELYTSLNSLSLRELIEVCETYKESVQAQAFLSTFITYLYSLMQKQHSPVLRTQLSTLLQTEQLLRTTNTSPRMALESALFAVKQTRELSD